MTDLTVKIISWNMGKSISKISDWVKELEKWDILSTDVDILFITIQEASSGMGCTFAAALKAKMGPNYKLWYEGEGTWIPFQNFHVFGYLFIKSTVDVIKPPHDNAIDSVCVYKKMYGISACTKPSVGAGIIVSKGGKTHKLIFVGSHLPINPKDVENGSLGLKDRVEAIKTIKKEIIDDIDKSLGGYDVIFWAGDLNFRVQTDGVEQLDQLLKDGELGGFREHVRAFNETCRYLEYDGVSNYDEFVAKRISKNGYDDKRKPSYCDRIIFKGSFEPTEYSTWPRSGDKYPLSIAYSDHEPVILKGIIPKTSVISMVGGSNYEMKYYKYKAKYMRLKNKKLKF
jgi:hypothetical protein